MKCRYLIPLLSGLGLAVPFTLQAQPQLIRSHVTRVSLLELYTSEGCSSCPPAEDWMSSLVDDTRLWKTLVPVQFHVTYWDELGWRDPFDSPLYTARQQQLSAVAAHGTVYTPEFMLDGSEWTGWFNHRRLQLDKGADAGKLALQISGDKIEATFAPSATPNGPLILNVALLAFDVTTAVGAGENAGRKLRHDFLVVGYIHEPMTRTPNGYAAASVIPQHVKTHAARYALAGWISLTGNPRPLQAAGDWLSATP